MAAYDAWGGSWGTSWGLSWTGEHAQTPTPPTVTPNETPAGARTRRRKIVLRVQGETREVADLEQLLDVLKAVKKDVPATARAAAVEAVRTGKRVSDVQKKAEIELVDAPYSMRDMVETRLQEIEREYSRRLAQYLKELDADDEDVVMIL